MLAQAGFPARGRGDAPWVELEYRGRQLAFDRLSSVADPAGLRDAVRDVLSAMLMRTSEHEELERVRERMEMLSAASFEGILIHIDGVVIDANRRVAEMLGLEPAEVLGNHTMRACVAPEDLPTVLARMSHRVEGEYVITGVRKDGSRFRAELHSKQGQLGSRPVRVVAVRDVTDRERTHALLRESEARMRELASAAFDFTIFSQEGLIVEVRGGVDAVLGLDRQRLLGMPLSDFIQVDANVVTEQPLDVRTGSFEAMLLGPGGTPVPVAVVAVVSTLDGAPVHLAGFRDLREARRLAAERRLLEQRAEQSQRLESLGVLAGGIAHDFNNLLVGVLGNAELLVERLSEGSDRQAALAIRSAGERARALTAQMLAYAGQRDLGRREPIDLGLLWPELCQLLEAALSKKARVELTLGPRSVVLGDRATITQLLMNLLTNASDALEGRPGTIRVRTERRNEPGASWQHALGAPLRAGSWLAIEVQDSGVGMDEATRARIFEPFFSTKPKGHGLGLAACLGIVSAHGGAIAVESEPGRGSCFRVLLPASDEAEQPRAEPGAPAKQARRTVLVVDDEAIVRSLLRRALERADFLVEEASDGQGALAALERLAPHVVILDMTMPDFGGVEVVRRIRQSGSRVPILLSSGYTDVALENELDEGAFQGFLLKPYGVSELLEAVERAIAAG